ncbi:hypothetical protein HYG86_05795 [Alkalicella caledoniensis]|uniref:Uncharacterized protein n=1 Tax=Alkalicella caledoniensis TaxID=2731377 RepID=A0A7G9W6K7_ALKCA|nr:hypothetical protein [Alkalicella caledoniensis]QNO14319.1 hypothetical protein HYG86_05795 [Alkalicella caledoniensis]
MNNIFKRKKTDVFLKILPLFMFKISLWCIYIILKGTQDEIPLAGIIALNVIFLFFIYTTVYKNNPTTILFEREYLQLTDLLKLKPKKVLWSDIYNITIVMHSKKTSFLKIFYVVDQDYLAYEISLSNFSEVEKIIRQLRIISEDKNYTFTEILVKELGELGDKKIVDKIDFCSIGAKANRRNQESVINYV